MKSTAILFGDADKLIIGILQGLTILTLIMAGNKIGATWPYYLSLLVGTGLFVYHQKLIKERERDACFQAFLNNHWFGVCVFIGLVMHYTL